MVIRLESLIPAEQMFLLEPALVPMLQQVKIILILEKLLEVILTIQRAPKLVPGTYFLGIGAVLLIEEVPITYL